MAVTTNSENGKPLGLANPMRNGKKEPVADALFNKETLRVLREEMLNTHTGNWRERAKLVKYWTAAYFAELLKDRDENVRMGVACTLQAAAEAGTLIGIPVRALGEVLSDENITVRYHAARTLAILRKKGAAIGDAKEYLERAREKYGTKSILAEDIRTALENGLE